MKSNQHSFQATIQLYTGQTQWQYVVLPKDVGEKVKQQAKVKKGTSAVLVEVTIEGLTWNTKLFDHKESGSYMLPIKLSPKSKLKVNDQVQVELFVLE